MFSVSMAGVWLAGTRERCVVSWALAGLFSAIGYLAGVSAADPRLAAISWAIVAIANGLIGLSHAFIFIGVRQFLRLPAYVAPTCIVIGLLFAAVLVSDELRTSLRLRVLLQSPAYLALAAAAGLSLLRSAAPGQRAMQSVTATVLLAYASFLFARWVSLLTPSGDGNALGYSPLQAAVFPVSLVFLLLMTTCVVLMLYRSKELALRALARIDSLTGLGNRAALEKQFGIEVSRVRRSGEPLSAVMVDLDHFKRINDTHGHTVGDAVLRAAAQVVDDGLRSSDCAFRFGGEEFLLLLPSTDAAAAVQVAERLRVLLAEHTVDTSAGPMQVSASFGVAQLQPDEGLDGLLERADRALYAAKHEGRNRVEASLDAPLGLQQGPA